MTMPTRGPAAALFCLACAALTPAAAQQQPTAEVIHSFTSKSEMAAMKAFSDAFTAAGGKWGDSAVAGMPNADTGLINRVIAGDPPAATRLIPGARLFALKDQDLLTTIDDVAAEGGWKDVLPAPVYAAIARDGHVWGAPFDISTQNFIFYNKEVLAKSGITELPQTWEDFIAALDKIKAAGFTPLALGGQPIWYYNMWTSVLVTTAGGDIFTRIYRDRDLSALEDPKVILAAERFRSLRAYVDEGSPGRNWNDATALVISGKAGFQLIGDWAKGEFLAAGLTPDKEFGCYIGFDGAPMIYGGNAFAFLKSKQPATIDGQKLLAKVVMDPAVQVEFARHKGSMPVRKDADVSNLDACARLAITYLADPARSVIQSETLVTAQEVGELRALMGEFFNDINMSPEEMLEAFADAL